ncbi:hypothetical protein D4S03_04330 [bacterium]|nr:MAG: hypothetical protein D4S03_04330 [bacterium]
MESLVLGYFDKVLTSGIHSIPTKPPFDNPVYVDPAAVATVLGNCVSTIGWKQKKPWFPSIPIGYDLSEFKEVICFAAPYQYYFLSMGQVTDNTIKFLNSLINIPAERIVVIIADPKARLLKNYGEKECRTTEKLLTDKGVSKELSSQVWKLCQPGKYYAGGLVRPNDFLCSDAVWVPIYYAGVSGKFSVGDHYTRELASNYKYDHVLYHTRAAARTANKDRGNYLNYITGKAGTIGFTMPGFECIYPKPVPPKLFYPILKQSKWQYICYPADQKKLIWGPSPRFLDSLVMGGIALYNENCEYLVKDPLLREYCLVPSPDKLDEVARAIPDNIKPEIYQKQLDMWVSIPVQPVLRVRVYLKCRQGNGERGKG